MNPFRCLLLAFLMTASLPAASQTMNFEQAMAQLSESCGADIDNNCRGVNLDISRLKECLRRNHISQKCEDNYPRVISAIEQRLSARANLSKLCNWELNRFCKQLRQDPASGLQCLLDSRKKATLNCNKTIDAAGYP